MTSPYPPADVALSPAVLAAGQSCEYRYMTTNLLTGEVQADWIPMQVQSITRVISGVGALSGSLILTSDPGLNQIYLNALEPRRSVLWVYQDARPIWNGIVWDWVPQSELDGLLPINAATLESLFSKRLIEEDFDFAGTDAFDIFRTLLAYAVGKQPNGQVANLLVPSGQSGQLITASYAATDLQSVADAWTNLAALGDFEYTFTPSVTSDGNPATQLQLGYPQLGQPASATGLVFQLPGNLLDDVFTRSGSAGANKVVATATGTAPSGPWPAQWSGDGVSAFPGIQSQQFFYVNTALTYGVSYNCYSPQGWSGDYGNSGVWAQIAWYDLNFNEITQTLNQPVVPLAPNTVATVDSGQQTPPGGTVWGQAVLQATETPPASTVFYAQPVPQATGYLTNGFIDWSSDPPAGNNSTFTENAQWQVPHVIFSCIDGTNEPNIESQTLPVVAGQSYGAAAWISSPEGWANGSNGVVAGMFWYDVDGNDLGFSGGFLVGLGPNTPVLVDSGLQVAPAGATQAQVCFFANNNTPSYVQFYVWAGAPSSGSTVTGYLTDTPGLVFQSGDDTTLSLLRTWEIAASGQNSYPAFVSDDSVCVDLIDIANGYPLLETSIAYQGSVAINSQDAINSFAQSQLALHTGTPATPVAYLGGQQIPLINQVNLGDGCYLLITSPTYPARPDGSPGMQVTGRVVGWTLQPPGSGQQEQAQIQLGAMQVEQAPTQTGTISHWYTGGPGN